MRQICFSVSDIEELHYKRFHYPHPYPHQQVQRKMEALYLKSQGYTHREISRLVQVAEPTGYWKGYLS